MIPSVRDGNPSMRRSRGICLRNTIASFLFLLFTFSPSMASSDKLSPEDVKIAFLYNFTKFVTWPENHLPPENGKIAVCVSEGTDLSGPVKLLEGKTSLNRGFEVVFIAKKPVSADITSCHISYTNKEMVAAPGVLTVGEGTDFVQSGGIIGFSIVEKTVKLKVNLDAAHRAGLTISSRLLKLVEIVKESE